MAKFAILVIWSDGEEEYLHQGLGTTPAMFTSKQHAREQADFMRIGMEGDCQSINVVPYPKLSKEIQHA